MNRTPENHRATHDSTDAFDERVRTLLAAAAAPTEPGPQPGEADALAAFRASSHRTRRFPMLSTRPRRLALASIVSAGVLVAGAGAAAAGALPGAAQQTARDMLVKVGIEVPGPDAHSAGHADQRGPAAEDGDDSTEETEESTKTEQTDDLESTDDTDGTDGTAEDSEETHGKGAVVSEMAQSDETQGREKGAAVSGYASDGHSRAGANTDDETDDDESTDGEDASGGRPGVATPNGGGTGTADDATDDNENSAGAPADGTGQADESSGGRSAAGSGNQS